MNALEHDGVAGPGLRSLSLAMADPTPAPPGRHIPRPSVLRVPNVLREHNREGRA